MSVITNANKSELLGNPNVLSLTDKQIIYTDQFKQQALELHESGSSAKNIWLQAGFNVTYFEVGYFRKALKRWKEQSKSVERPKRGRKANKKFKSLEEEIEYLRAENAFLKELKALGK